MSGQLSSALTDLMSLTLGSEQYWLYTWTFFKTWELELSPDFMLLTFMTVHLFQFRFAVTV